MFVEQKILYWTKDTRCQIFQCTKKLMEMPLFNGFSDYVKWFYITNCAAFFHFKFWNKTFFNLCIFLYIARKYNTGVGFYINFHIHLKSIMPNTVLWDNMNWCPGLNKCTVYVNIYFCNLWIVLELMRKLTVRKPNVHLA